MGCDIEVVLEKKFEGKWVGCRTFENLPIRYNDNIATVTTRNYRRFARLAGVRGDGPKPLGLPEDMSDLTRMLVSDIFYCFSYMDLIDANDIFFQTESGPLSPASPGKYLRSMFGVYKDEVERYRIVFWFVG